MGGSYDLGDLREEIEVIELGLPIEEGILDFGENEEDIFAFEPDGQVVNANLPDLSKATFSQHTESVYGTLNCAGTIAVTGAEDATAFVWSTQNCEVLFECIGHKNSVTELVFNHDEQLLATGDIGGLLQVWDVANKKLIWCYEGEELIWLTWHPKTNVLFAGFYDGHVFIWQVPQENCKVLASPGFASICGIVLSDGLRLLAGYGNGQVRLWDIKTSSVIWELHQSTPVEPIFSMNVTEDENLFIIVPSARVLNVCDGSLVTTLDANETHVEGAAFSNESGLVATGTLSGVVRIWDIKTSTIRHEAKMNGAVTVIKWGSNDKLLFGCNTSIYVVDGKSGNFLQTLTGHKSDIFSLSMPKDETVLLSTSDDFTAKIFALQSNET